MTRPDRVNYIPPFARADLILVDFAAAPGSQNHLRICGNYRLRRNYPALGVALASKMRKNALTAREFDQCIHPTNAANQRIVPLLEEDPRAPRESPGRFRNLRKLTAKPRNKLE